MLRQFDGAATFPKRSNASVDIGETGRLLRAAGSAVALSTGRPPFHGQPARSKYWKFERRSMKPDPDVCALASAMRRVTARAAAVNIPRPYSD